MKTVTLFHCLTLGEINCRGCWGQRQRAWGLWPGQGTRTSHTPGHLLGTVALAQLSKWEALSWSISVGWYVGLFVLDRKSNSLILQRETRPREFPSLADPLL